MKMLFKINIITEEQCDVYSKRINKMKMLNLTINMPNEQITKVKILLGAMNKYLNVYMYTTYVQPNILQGVMLHFKLNYNMFILCNLYNFKGDLIL